MGHDLFEGVVSTDLSLYIKQLVTVGKHFTYNQLNRIISTFKYAGADGNNKPCEIRADSQKLGVNAAQNWCLLRLLPLLVGDRTKNPLEDEIWQLCLLLREIVNTVTAPKIHAIQVAYLKALIEQYIDSRFSLFTTTKAPFLTALSRTHTSFWSTNSVVDFAFRKQALIFQAVCKKAA